MTKRRCSRSARRAAKTRVRIEHRKQRQSDARRGRGRGDPLRHFGAVCVRRAGDVVVKVVKLGDGAVAGFEHLDIGLGGDRLDVVGSRREREAVHRFAPGPETVGRLRRAVPSSRPWRAERRANADLRSRARRSRSARRRPQRAASRSTEAMRRAVDPHAHVRGPAIGVSARPKCNVVIVRPSRLT